MKLIKYFFFEDESPTLNSKLLETATKNQFKNGSRKIAHLDCVKFILGARTTFKIWFIFILHKF